MAQFGVSFVPGQNGGDNGEQQGRPTADRLQRAIQILSLRLPRRPNIQGAIAPAPLLQAQGGLGSPFGRSAIAQTQQQPGNLDPVMQALLQLAGMGPGVGAPPTPRVIPGIQSPTQPKFQGQPPAIPSGAGYGEQFAQPWGLPAEVPNAPGWEPPPAAPSGGMDWLAPFLRRKASPFGDDVF